jgi:hypothetical protein
MQLHFVDGAVHDNNLFGGNAQIAIYIRAISNK